ncbi:transcriptional regulator, AfsR/DnrI/RedD family [Piscinibacter sakaiensis]|uniref:Transcriptional regulator, AfsR/DnrI/RedD family n=1 Tax=Piscinibacter sakaiensis TaxID=1547922 RepID=A0A0K8P7Q0_PISS1|nr:transcriptional regulator, AfsR/DnrI/RedD family [Piscinibacter sakaiensis]
MGGNPAWLLECLKSLWLGRPGDGAPAPPSAGAVPAPGTRAKTAMTTVARDPPPSPRDRREIPLPPTLREAVRLRLQRLPEPALQLAQVAAVAGGDFSLGLAAALLGRNLLGLAPALGALEQAQVFQGLGFAHDLVAEAVLDSLPRALRPALHRGVAAQLQAQQAPAAAIADHLQAAGEAAAAAPWWLQAAARARRQWQMAEAAAAYAAAAPALPQRAARFAAWCDAARCALWVRHPSAEAALVAAEALAERPEEAARLRTLRTIAHFGSRRLDAALAEAGPLMTDYEHLGAALPPATLADGVRVLTSLVASGLDVGRLRALVDRLAPHVEPEAEARLALRTARAGLLHWDGWPREGVAALEPALAQAEQEADPGLRVTLGNQLMRMRHAVGDHAGARALGERVLAQSEPLEMGVVFRADVMHVVAMIEVAAGQAPAGLARFEALLARLAAAGARVPDLFLTSQAQALAVAGRGAAARALLDRHPAPGRPGQGTQDLHLLLTRARLDHRDGRDPSADLARAAEVGALPTGLVLQRAALAAALQGGDPDALAALVDELGTRGLVALQRLAAQGAARAAVAAGRPDQAVAMARQALARAAEVDAWVDEPASAWVTAHEVFAACGESAAARDAAHLGAAAVREGAAAWRRAAEREAWLHGNPLHRRLLAVAG